MLTRRRLRLPSPALLLVPVLATGGATAAILTSPAAAVAAPAQARVSSHGSSCPSPGGVRVPEKKEPTGASVVIYGHGWGHGMGMSQYGAQGAARLGCDYATILTTYYRGTRVVTRSMSAPVRLTLDAAASRSTVVAEQKTFAWKAGDRNVLQPKGSTWSVAKASKDGKAGLELRDSSGDRRLWVASGATLSASHVGATVRLRTYRGSSLSSDRTMRQGVLRFVRHDGGVSATELIKGDSEHSAVQKYLWGLGEVPVSWPGQALRAQVVAARTYLAGRYDSGAKQYVIGVTTSDQVYRGAAAEDNDARYGSHWKAAVNGTGGKVVVDGHGDLITTMYSSSMGGHTENRAFVYGSQGGFGYLSGIDDSRWDAASDNPYRSWVKGYSKATFAAKLGFTSVTRVAVGRRGTAARDEGVQVTGVRNGRTVTKSFTGGAFRSAFGLRSPGFEVAFGIGGTGAQALVGDWDGDGRTDTGWYRNPNVSLRTATGKRISYRFDVPGARAVVADFDGDGKDSVSLFRAGTWHVRHGRSTTARTGTVVFGRAGDVPIAGRWSPSATRDNAGVVRGGSTWILRTSKTTSRSFTWKPATGTPAVGDWDGNGVDGPAVRRGATWYLGADVPGRGKGTVKAPALWRTMTYVNARGSVTAGTARVGRVAAPTIVRGTRFIWRAPSAKVSSIRTQTFRG